MADTQTQHVSWIHRSGRRPSGISWWGERPTWVRHVTYWVIALLLVASTAINNDADDIPTTGDELVAVLWIVIVVMAVAIMVLVASLMEWEEVGILRTISRSLVLFSLVLGFSAGALAYWGTHAIEINRCQVEDEREVCSGQASPRQTLSMLAWHAADVVPVLHITDSFEWERPARSESVVVGAAIMMIRLWVAVGVLAIIKRLWDRWGPWRSVGATRS
jgi:hypothetical protein